MAIRSPKCFDLDESAAKTAGFRGCGLPRRFAPRNDIQNRSFFYNLQQAGRKSGLFFDLGCHREAAGRGDLLADCANLTCFQEIAMSGYTLLAMTAVILCGSF